MTGALYVALDFHEQESVDWNPQEPFTEIPSVPSQWEAIVNKVETLPVEDLMVAFQATSKQVQESLARMDEVSARVAVLCPAVARKWA